MIYADDIKKRILLVVKHQSANVPLNPDDVAKEVDPENWRSLVDRVKLVAESMIQDGQLKVPIKSDNK